MNSASYFENQRYLEHACRSQTRGGSVEEEKGGGGEEGGRVIFVLFFK